MRNYSTIFRQLLNMLPRDGFESAVSEHGGDYYTKHFTSWNQLLVNLYAQVSGKNSLRDIETGLRVQQNSWYHLGLKNVARSTIAYANQRRSSYIYEQMFYQVLTPCATIINSQGF